MGIPAKDVLESGAPCFDENRKSDLVYLYQYSSGLISRIVKNCHLQTEKAIIIQNDSSELKVNPYIHRTGKGARLGILIVWPTHLPELSQNFWDRLYCELCRDITVLERRVENEQLCNQNYNQ